MSTCSSLRLKTLIILCLLPLIHACDRGAHSAHTKASDKVLGENNLKKDVPAHWEMTQVTDGNIFAAKFSCNKPPHVGDFQVCHLALTNEGKIVSGAKVSIDGGMKAHGHGLPTTPQVRAAEIPGQYIIEGLKFSMPGEWIVGFKIVLNERPDQVIFTFSI